MSDKYDEWAREYLTNSDTRVNAALWKVCNALVDSLMLDFARFVAAKLEEETCEWGRTEENIGTDRWHEYRTACGVTTDCIHDKYCTFCGRRLIEREYIIAPTSAGGTTKSVAVTPDEGSSK